MPECGCEFSDNADRSGLRLQYEVVCLGLSVTLLPVLLPTGAPFCRFLSLKDGLQQYEDSWDGETCT